MIALEQMLQRPERIQCPLGFIGGIHILIHDLGFQP